LDVLERWIKLLPTALKPHLATILPLLSQYLRVTEVEETESKGTDEKVKTTNRKRTEAQVYKSAIASATAAYDRFQCFVLLLSFLILLSLCRMVQGLEGNATDKEIVQRILRLLGSLGGNSNLVLTDQVEKDAIVWDSKVLTFFFLLLISDSPSFFNRNAFGTHYLTPIRRSMSVWILCCHDCASWLRRLLIGKRK
jgi:hypothetical protein